MFLAERGSFMRRWIAGAVAAFLALLLAAQPLLAADPTPRTVGLRCDDGVCRARLYLGADVPAWVQEGVWLEVAQAAISRLPGGELAVRDQVLLALPSGPLHLLDADLRFTLDDEGRVATLSGSAQLPAPLFGLLGDGQVIAPARVALGVEYGRELQYLTAPLEPARRYFFIELAAGMGLLTGGVNLAVAPGARATLVVDFVQPLVFVDGGITIRSDGQMAWVQQWLDGSGEWGIPAELPLRQMATFQMQAQAGREVAPQIAAESMLRFDAGRVGQWLRLDATPLHAHGRAVIGADGLQISGTLASSLAPEHVYTGAAQASLFVPFVAPETTALSLEAEARAPWLAWDSAGKVTFAGAPGWHTAWAATTWQGMVAGTQSSAAWLGDSLASSGAWLVDGTRTAWAGTQERWCAFTGWCGEVAPAGYAMQIVLGE